MTINASLYHKIESLEPTLRDILLGLAEEVERAHQESIIKEDFHELKEIVKDLAASQNRTDLQVKELVEAQKRTERRVEELAEAQKRTEHKIEELTEAQRKTEISLNNLINKVGTIEERLEDISNSVGYTLENKSYTALPFLLKDDGIKISGKIIRRYYPIVDKNYQINIFAKAKKDDKDILLLGEVKVRPSKKEIDRFLKIAEWIKKEEGWVDTYLLFVAHDYHPDIEVYLREKSIRYFWSYELEITEV